MSVLTYPTNYHVKMLADLGAEIDLMSHEAKKKKISQIIYESWVKTDEPASWAQAYHSSLFVWTIKANSKAKCWFTCTVWFESLLFTQAGICLFPRNVSNDIRRKAQVGGWVGISRMLCIVFYQYLQIVNNGLRCICKIIIYTRIKYFQTDNSKIPVQRSFG